MMIFFQCGTTPRRLPFRSHAPSHRCRMHQCVRKCVRKCDRGGHIFALISMRIVLICLAFLLEVCCRRSSGLSHASVWPMRQMRQRELA
jgi:hypothetical protein